MEPKEENTVPYYIGKITEKNAVILKKTNHTYYLVKFQYKQETRGDETIAKGYVPIAVYFTDKWTPNESDIPITNSIEIEMNPTDEKEFGDKELVNIISNNTMYLPTNQESFIVVFVKTNKTPATYNPTAIRITEEEPTYTSMFHIDKYKYEPSSTDDIPLLETVDNSVHYVVPDKTPGADFGIPGKYGGKRKRPRYSRKRIKQYRKKSRVRKVY
jgi:hypothetical protein